MLKHLPGKHNQKTHGSPGPGSDHTRPLHTALDNWLRKNLSTMTGYIDRDEIIADLLDNEKSADLEGPIISLLDGIVNSPTLQFISSYDRNSGSFSMFVNTKTSRQSTAVTKFDIYKRGDSKIVLFSPVSTDFQYLSKNQNLEVAEMLSLAKKAGFDEFELDTHANFEEVADFGLEPTIPDSPGLIRHLIKNGLDYLEEKYGIKRGVADVDLLLMALPEEPTFEDLINLKHHKYPDLSPLVESMGKLLMSPYHKKL